MAARRKICVITGTRAEYGLLYWVMRAIRAERSFKLALVATGMHVSPEFGFTCRAIEADGFRIDEKPEILLSADTPVAIAKSIGLGTIELAGTFARLKPDLVMVAGDRFELLAAAQAAHVARIPIAHLFGGDSTEGAIDEAFRHSITKMSQIHFPSNAEAARRIRQMGEDPATIFTVGSPGLDHVRRLKPLKRGPLEKELGFRFGKRNLLITFHPVTLEKGTSKGQMEELLAALGSLDPATGLLFTKANSDTDGRVINTLIDRFVAGRSNAVARTSLGQKLYLSLLGQVDAVVGNSSSGLYEAPSFRIPTVNIGDRQKGRLRAASVIDCPPVREAIAKALRRASSLDCSRVVNPYGDGRSAPRIVSALKSLKDWPALLKKRFHFL